MNFKVNIELGNDAMCTGMHVAELLRRIADRVQDGMSNDLITQNVPVKVPVRDLNGSTVGEWAIE